MDPINATNITQLQWWIAPLIDKLGGFAFPLIFMLGLLILWTSIATDRLFMIFLYLAILGFAGVYLFEPIIVGMMLILTAITTGTVWYLGLFKRGSNL